MRNRRRALLIAAATASGSGGGGTSNAFVVSGAGIANANGTYTWTTEGNYYVGNQQMAASDSILGGCWATSDRAYFIWPTNAGYDIRINMMGYAIPYYYAGNGDPTTMTPDQFAYTVGTGASPAPTVTQA